MTETELAQTLQATALAAHLKSAVVPQKLVAYRGALTPLQLDAPEREMAALLAGAAVHDLGWMRRVVARGEDRFRWLSGMVTNTVNDLFPSTGAWNLVLNAQGHIQGDLTVWRGGEEFSPERRKTEATGHKDDEPVGERLLGRPFAGESGLELEIAADQIARLLAYMNRFIIMDDVELLPLGAGQADKPGTETALGLSGPLAEDVLGRLGLPSFAHPMTGAQVEWNGHNLKIVRGYGVLAPHYELWLPVAGLPLLWAALKTAGASPVGCASLDAMRIAESIPVDGGDILDRDLPQENSQTRALHFNKGCYLGQEIVERIRSRGGVRRHLRPLELTGVVPAARVELTLADGSPAGHITSAAELKLDSGARIFALGMIRAEAEKNEQQLAYTGGTARLLTAPPTFKGKQ